MHYGKFQKITNNTCCSIKHVTLLDTKLFDFPSDPSIGRGIKCISQLFCNIKKDKAHLKEGNAVKTRIDIFVLKMVED